MLQIYVKKKEENRRIYVKNCSKYNRLCHMMIDELLGTLSGTKGLSRNPHLLYQIQIYTIETAQSVFASVEEPLYIPPSNFNYSATHDYTATGLVPDAVESFWQKKHSHKIKFTSMTRDKIIFPSKSIDLIHNTQMKAHCSSFKCLEN